MARLQLIFPLMFWLAWASTDPYSPWTNPWTGTAIYLSGLTLIVALMRWRSRLAMRRATVDRPAPVPRFHRSMFAARWAVLAWHGVALFGLGYGTLVKQTVPAWDDVESPQAFASMLPLLIAWVGLIWTQYPLDRAVREQNALIAMEFGEPVHAVPTLREYLGHAIRAQMLLTLAPLLAIWALRDVLRVGVARFAWLGPDDAKTLVVLVAATAGAFFSPEILRRVLPTQPLAPSPLRDRLTALATRTHTRFRDILFWRTHYTVGNAAVMGLVPRLRYVLLSDLLLETMTQDQVESVFAHELGHVVHRHMPWYLLYWVMAGMGMGEVGDLVEQWMTHWHALSRDAIEWIVPVVGGAVALGVFGMLSRAFERQADFFAARRLSDDGQPLQHGAAVFVSALRQVATINNMPLDARGLMHGRRWLGRVLAQVMHHLTTWLHGSIRSRMDHLTRLADRPAAASRFDRAMFVVRCVILVGVSASIAWAVVDRFGGGL